MNEMIRDGCDGYREKRQDKEDSQDSRKEAAESRRGRIVRCGREVFDERSLQERRREDRRLVDRCLRQEDDAWCELILRLRGVIKRAISRMTYDCGNEVREDLFQETCLRLVTGLEGFRGDSSIAFFAARIATNLCISHHRSRLRRPVEVSLNEPLYDDGPSRLDLLPSPELRPDELFEVRERFALLGMALARLTPVERRSLAESLPFDLDEDEARIQASRCHLNVIRYRAIRKMQQWVESEDRRAAA